MAGHVYRFGEFRLDPASRELWRGDEELALPPKAFGCLVYLVEHRDRAVGREELVAAVWGKEILADSVLGRAILKVRRALDDTAEEHQYIKTVWGFGYRWMAPVEIEDASAAPVGAPLEPRAAPGRRSSRHRPLLAAVMVTALAAAAVLVWRDGGTESVTVSRARAEEGTIALVLPVAVETPGSHGWIRFGVMALIAERLRAAGQPMVPSETVIALTRDLSDPPDPEELERLTSTSGARLVLAARAEAIRGGWRVAVRSLAGARPPLTVRAEAEDVLEAARAAADQAAFALGLTPTTDAAAKPGLARLLQQVRAAMLAQRLDAARSLIESAGGELRRQPRVRLQAAELEYHQHRLDASQATLESLLEELGSERDRVLRARVLLGLGSVHLRRGEYDSAETFLARAVRLLERDDAGEAVTVRGHARFLLGNVVAINRGVDAAREHLARGRADLESTGDVLRLSSLNNNLGVLAVLEDRYTEALRSLDRAARSAAALHDVGSELRARANMVEVRLGLLEPRTALELEPRIEELLARSDNPELTALGQLARTALFAANGRLRAADGAWVEVTNALERGGELPAARTWAHVLRAEQLARGGKLEGAVELAATTVEEALARNDDLLDDYVGRAWLIVLRGRLAAGDVAAAAEIAATMDGWAADSPARAAATYAALARAELAAAEGRDETATAAFEHALTVAEAGQVPLRSLQVAQRYVPWLLDDGRHGRSDPERALLVADRVAPYARQDYRAALVQLRVYQALGLSSAWRASLERALALAGERSIPAELTAVPPDS